MRWRLHPQEVRRLVGFWRCILTKAATSSPSRRGLEEHQKVFGASNLQLVSSSFGRASWQKPQPWPQAQIVSSSYELGGKSELRNRVNRVKGTTWFWRMLNRPSQKVLKSLSDWANMQNVLKYRLEWIMWCFSGVKALVPYLHLHLHPSLPRLKVTNWPLGTRLLYIAIYCISTPLCRPT